jgi:hypothetical protein
VVVAKVSSGATTRADAAANSARAAFSITGRKPSTTSAQAATANAPTTNTAMRTNMAWRNGTAPAVGGAGSGATVWGEADMID